MPLSEPLPHRLVEGEIGEVIPAELLQRTAAFGDSAVEMLHRDHQRDFRGLMQHKGLEFAAAGACFVMPVFAGTEWRDTIETDLSGGFNLWGFGWNDEPKLVKDPAAYNQELKTAWVRFWIECSLPGPEEPFLHVSAEYADAGLGAASPLVVIKQNKRFRIYVGHVSIADPGGDAVYTPSYSMQWVRRVYLWATK